MSRAIVIPEGVTFEWSPGECEYCGQSWHAAEDGRCSSCSAKPKPKPTVVILSNERMKNLTCEEVEQLKLAVKAY